MGPLMGQILDVPALTLQKQEELFWVWSGQQTGSRHWYNANCLVELSLQDISMICEIPGQGFQASGSCLGGSPLLGKDLHSYSVLLPAWSGLQGPFVWECLEIDTKDKSNWGWCPSSTLDHPPIYHGLAATVCLYLHLSFPSPSLLCLQFSVPTPPGDLPPLYLVCSYCLFIEIPFTYSLLVLHITISAHLCSANGDIYWLSCCNRTLIRLL